ncbi:MAG: dethiobiotin synthase [Bacillota bacterium]
MGSGFFITGTDTGIGKTVVTAGLLAALRAAGIDAAAFKPVQSGALRTGDGLVSQDAAFFLKVSGLAADVSDYNLYCLEQPFSPHLAAEMSGKSIAREAILARCGELLANHRVLLVEGAGGICVPLTRKGYTVAHLAGDLGFPLLVVARPALGTINHTVLTIKYAQMFGLQVAGFIFNGLRKTGDILEEDNAKVIKALTGVPLLGKLPHIPGLDVDGGFAGELAEIAGRHLCWREIGGMA